MAKNSATARNKVGYGNGPGSPKRQRKNNGQNDDSPFSFEPSTIPVFQVRLLILHPSLSPTKSGFERLSRFYDGVK